MNKHQNHCARYLLSAAKIDSLAEAAWSNMTPCWPLKNFIAVNALKGFDHLPIEEALMEGALYRQQDDLPAEMEEINRQTIKWMQVISDEGQATIPFPSMGDSAFEVLRRLVQHDRRLHRADKAKKHWLKEIPSRPEDALVYALQTLSLQEKEYPIFLTLMLTTLPGWAGYVAYQGDWSNQTIPRHKQLSKIAFLAIRTLITAMVWPDVITLLAWHANKRESVLASQNPIDQIRQAEGPYRSALLSTLAAPVDGDHTIPQAQFVFCIDVRSEPFRRALESTGNYETYGFAGFFGLPIQINNTLSAEKYSTCPVLLTPKHTIIKSKGSNKQDCELTQIQLNRFAQFKRFYQSMKYIFTTPFVLVELLGLPIALWMACWSMMPSVFARLKKSFVSLMQKEKPDWYGLNTISLDDQVIYAEQALRGIGLIRCFAPLVVFCGHASSTHNNPYASSLDCGACAGRAGGDNANILAQILNTAKVRSKLIEKGIEIPPETRFVGAQHDTTTDMVKFNTDIQSHDHITLKANLRLAQKANCLNRSSRSELCIRGDPVKDSKIRSQDWSETRPEWGLAKNASFIIGPRNRTQHIDLCGRSFLHSYNDSDDVNGEILTGILTAPMVVAHWINAQYLLSTLDNAAYGSGSKVTQNVTGKIGIMQGNASDLMTGLPLQSVYRTDNDAYHEMQRLMTIVFASPKLLKEIILKQDILKKLIGNGWVSMFCIEPKTNQPYKLSRNFIWEKQTILEKDTAS